VVSQLKALTVLNRQRTGKKRGPSVFFFVIIKTLRQANHNKRNPLTCHYLAINLVQSGLGNLSLWGRA
jgi:hypothetical protein